jgi:septum formation protein
VWLDKFYNKPADFNDAVRMLSELSGRRHNVYTGVCVRRGNKSLTFCEESCVTFKKLTEEQIENYVNTYKPYDKAGAYGIQHGEIIENYEGDLDNIVGLPMERLGEKVGDFFN